jgi:hypothetical protein
MSSLRRTLLVAASAFVSALVGFALQWVIPTQAIADGRPALGAVAGLLTLLLALVLGLLVWTAFGVYTTQQTESQTLGLTTLQLDYLLESYGPETMPGRLGLREAVKRSRDRYFGSRTTPDLLKFSQSRNSLHLIDMFFESLAPQDEPRKQILAAARPLATSIVQTQLLMARQLSNPLPTLLLVMVHGWACLLFLCFGLTASVSAISIAADALGSFAVASALFLIIELSEPYSGLVRISSANIDSVLADLAENMRSPPDQRIEAGAPQIAGIEAQT